MRAASILPFILAASLVALSGARADGPDANFRIGAWQGAPVSTDGAFAFCGMTALYGQKSAPAALTVALDARQGWTVAVSSDQLRLPVGTITAGLAFDDEAPVEIEGEASSPVMMSFHFRDTAILDRHAGARKLVLIFSDMAQPFMLSRFAEAVAALKSCQQSGAGAPTLAAESTPAAASASPPAASAQIAAPVAIRADAAPWPPAGRPAPTDLRLFSDLVGPLAVGFVGSVLIVVLAGFAFFEITQTRRKSEYRGRWSAEYRSAHPQAAASSILGSLARQPSASAAA